jgi:hypothetical protein
VLDSWQGSQGSNLEVAVGLYLELPVRTVDVWLYPGSPVVAGPGGQAVVVGGPSAPSTGAEPVEALRAAHGLQND